MIEQLEKIRTIKEASTEGEFTKEVWKKVASGKVKVDKGYNQVKRFQRIKEAEEFVKNDLKSLSASELFDLQFGDMKTLGENIPDNSIDLIFTDPPYNEASLALYGDLAKLADRVLKPGGSLVTYVGHYAIFKINDLIQMIIQSLSITGKLLLNIVDQRVEYMHVIYGHITSLFYGTINQLLKEN